MNGLGMLLVWTGAQVTLFCILGAAGYARARRRNPAAGAWAIGAVMAGVALMSALAFSPWPSLWVFAITAWIPKRVSSSMVAIMTFTA